MGSRIAAHFANAGYPVDLLDIVLPGQPPQRRRAGRHRGGRQPEARAVSSPLAARSLDHARQFRGRSRRAWRRASGSSKPSPKIWTSSAPCCERVAEVRTPGTILSTNTSGIPLADIAEGFRRRVPRAFSGHALLQSAALPAPGGNDSRTGNRARGAGLGVATSAIGTWAKAWSRARTRPNFIANRIGSFFGATIHKLTVEDGYTVEEVDALTGPLIGLPKSASFRLVDIVGLDVWAHVLRNLHELVPARSRSRAATACRNSWST